MAIALPSTTRRARVVAEHKLVREGVRRPHGQRLNQEIIRTPGVRADESMLASNTPPVKNAGIAREDSQVPARIQRLRYGSRS